MMPSFFGFVVVLVILIFLVCLILMVFYFCFAWGHFWRRCIIDLQFFGQLCFTLCILLLSSWRLLCLHIIRILHLIVQLISRFQNIWQIHQLLLTLWFAFIVILWCLLAHDLVPSLDFDRSTILGWF